MFFIPYNYKPSGTLDEESKRQNPRAQKMSETVEEAESKTQQQQPTRKPLRQPPSVPFIWEQRPGLPIKNWKPSPSAPMEAAETAAAAAPPTLPPPLPPPVKLVASVPFLWEETPGKPLPCFADDLSHESSDQPAELLCLPPPPMFANHDIGDESDGIGSDDDDTSSNSFSSAPSLLAANCLVPFDAISGAVPVDEFDDLKKETMSLPTSPGYDSDDSTSSYMTGASSLVGASFLEKLFPLLPQDSGLVRNVPTGCEDVPVSHVLAEVNPKASATNISFPVRKPATLGELIMMSRRRSYMRKAIEMKKQNPPMEFPENGAAKCCLLVPGIKMIEGLDWRKFQPRLKLN